MKIRSGIDFGYKVTLVGADVTSLIFFASEEESTVKGYLHDHDGNLIFGDDKEQPIFFNAYGTVKITKEEI